MSTKPSRRKNEGGASKKQRATADVPDQKNDLLVAAIGASAGGIEARHQLSKRELEVMRLLVKGKSNKEIAATLTLSPRTVETYRARLMSKLGLHSFADLILHAVRNRLVED